MVNLLQRFRKKRRSLASSFVLMVNIILAVTMGTAVYVNYHFEKNELTKQLINKGKLLGNFVADVSKTAILGYDFVLVDQYMEDIASENEIVYSMIVAPDNSNFSSQLNNTEKYSGTPAIEKPVDIIKQVNKHEDIIAQKFPIYFESRLIGTLLIGLSREHVNQQSLLVLRYQTMQCLVIIAILSLAISATFRKKAVKPIQNLIDSAGEIAGGKLDNPVKVTHTEELARLAEAFNVMIEALNDSNSEKDKTLLQLQSANQKLEEVTQAKSDFLANMSHEIRTPLTAILGYAESLRIQDIAVKPDDEAIDSIIRNGQHLQHILCEILDLTKIEANKLEIEHHPVSPIDLLHEFESLVSLQAKTKHLDFNVDLVFPLPERIETDPIRLKQILLNLCNNAIKFTSQGHVNMSVRYDQEHHQLAATVVDTGIGLSAEQQQKIFQPFTQGDTSTTRKFGGTGLGLALSRKLAKMLGGDITVISSLGEGSQFTLTIATGDIADQKLIYSAYSSDLKQSHTNPSPEGPTIPMCGNVLLVEDTIDNQKLFSLLIKRTGATLTIASNGLEAVNAVQNQSFDLILMDIQMPVMDGIEAVKKIRELEIDTPVIALTANAFKEFRESCLDSGFDDYIAKPIDMSIFYDTICSYMQPIDKEEVLNPLYSELVAQDPEFSEIVDGFLGRLPQMQNDLAQAFARQDWDSCQKRIHEIKGLGGAMGYPDLSDEAKTTEDLIKSESYQQLEAQLNKLYHTFDCMVKGRDKIQDQNIKADTK